MNHRPLPCPSPPSSSRQRLQFISHRRWRCSSPNTAFLARAGEACESELAPASRRRAVDNLSRVLRLSQPAKARQPVVHLTRNKLTIITPKESEDMEYRWRIRPDYNKLAIISHRESEELRPLVYSNTPPPSPRRKQ